MITGDCQKIAEAARQETDLIKKAMQLNKSSQCYKKRDNNTEQYEALKKEAINAFREKADKFEDPHEKSLFLSYEALCWICLGELEKATELANKALKLLESKPIFKEIPIVNFTKFLATKEVEKAQEIWKSLYMNFSQGIVELLEEAFIIVNPASEPPMLGKPLTFSKRWTILLKGKSDEPEKVWTLDFFDAHEALKQKLVLKKEFVDDLLAKVKEVEYYHFIKNIRKVSTSTGEDFSDKALFIVLATSAEKKLRFGLLLGTLKDGGVQVVGLWPEAFAQAIGTDEGIIGAFITRSVKEPEWFSDLNILTFIPADGAKEGGSNDEKEFPPEYFT